MFIYTIDPTSFDYGILLYVMVKKFSQIYRDNGEVNKYSTNTYISILMHSNQFRSSNSL